MGRWAIFYLFKLVQGRSKYGKNGYFRILCPMMKTTEAAQTYIVRLKQQIEEKLAWGNSTQWTHQDFDTLSERIWEDTEVKLSATTLKRVWGKVSYQSSPTTSTLNALARFAGYDHWRDFVGQHEEVQPSEYLSPASPSTLWWTKRRMAVFVGLPLLMVVLLFFNRWINRTDAIDGSMISFSSEPVTQGLPNTVVFHYDVSQVPSENIAIQQSWDKRLRTPVARESAIHTSTYYYPGYFRAKLLVNDRMVQEHDLYIESDGWMTIAEAAPVPNYLPSGSSVDGQMQVATELLRQQELLTRDEVPWINYYYVQDFGELSANNFTLETRIRNDFKQGEAVCQTSQVNVICSKGHFALPLSIPGCVGQLMMAMGKERISGASHDLSALGTNLSEWQTLRCEVQDRQVRLFLNDQIVYEGAYADNVGKVVGLRYRFHGPGAIDYVRLSDEAGETVYEEDFEAMSSRAKNNS